MQHNVPVLRELNTTWIKCDAIARHAFAMPPQHFRGLMNAYDSQKRVKKLIRTVRDDDDYVECRSLLRLIDWHEAYSHERLPHLPALKVFLRSLGKKRKRALNQALRIDIAYRQGYACNACGLFPIPPTFQLDHVIRLADGGADDVDNLQALCVECHARKTRSEATGRAPVACEKVFSKYFLHK